MRRLLVTVGLLCALTSGASAQRHGFGGGFGHRGGGFRGFPGRFHGGFRAHRFGFRTTPFLPAFGFYGSGYWGWPYWGLPYDYSDIAPATYAYPPAPNVTIIYLPPAPSYEAPQLVSAPEARSRPAPPPPPEKHISFEFSFKDGTTRSVAAFWIEGDVLHYFDENGDRGQFQLSDIDRARSLELNRSRGIDFRLPPQKP